MTKIMLTRRTALLSAAALAACKPTPQAPADTATTVAPPPDYPRFTAIEQTLGGGTLGVAAFNTATGAWLRNRADERFAMCSTFKWVLAAFILNKVQDGALRLDAQVRYTRADLLGNSPGAEANVARGWMTIEELCAASVEQSDNAAANLLFAQVGGPAALDDFVHRHGDSVTSFDRTEPELNNIAAGDERDTTTPVAMASTMQRLLLTDSALNEASRQKLLGWLEAAVTGVHRLKAGLPAGWRIGHKTGTSGQGAANDVAILWPPSGPPILLACFVLAPQVDDTVRDAAHAAVARAVAETWG
ncbi:class A beta-lactamase [Terricaulis sp.]|uniref:class A beta-lactamase n=1 Tax=Terricaulis sp. TaxID=2768686 RepID=UPI0037838C90